LIEMVCRVALIGIGDMSTRFVAALMRKEGFVIVGAADSDPSKVGKDLGEYANLAEVLNVKIERNTKAMLKREKPNVTLIATTSFVKQILPLIVMTIRAGSNVITPAEEMIYLPAQYPRIAAKIDRLARRHNVAVLGTGANPGFFPDTLIIALTAICLRVDSVRSARINDMAWGSMAVLKSLGVGFTPEEFEKGVRDGKIAGHVGFHESIHMIADKMGWKLDEVQIDKKPIVSKTRRIADIGLEVRPGTCAGCAEEARGIMNGKPVVELKLIQQIRPETEGIETGDFIWVQGEPDINEAIKPGIRGSVSTAAMLLNAIPGLLEAKPGLHSTAGLPSPHCFTKLQRAKR